MREIAYTKRFRQDYKRIKKRGWDVQRLEAAVDTWARGRPLPPKARPHKLSGNFNEAWDIHLAGDWVLIYEISGDLVSLRERVARIEGHLALPTDAGTQANIAPENEDDG